MLPAPATIVVNLPADATLTVDDTATTSTSGRRVLVSPELPRGATYSYTLKGEIMRDGQKVTASKQINVRGGEQTEVALEFPPQRVASK